MTKGESSATGAVIALALVVIFVLWRSYGDGATADSTSKETSPNILSQGHPSREQSIEIDSLDVAEQNSTSASSLPIPMQDEDSLRAPESTQKRTDQSAQDGTDNAHFTRLSDGSIAISSSIRDACNKEDSSCQQVLSLLKAFVEEARDSFWGDSSESTLHNLVLSTAGDFSIRGIECRSSLCVIEVESHSGPFLGGDREIQRKQGLGVWYGLHAYEDDDQGETITVTLLTYKRRR